MYLHYYILKVKEWLQNLGIGDHAPVVQDDDDADDETVPLHHDESSKNRFLGGVCVLDECLM